MKKKHVILLIVFVVIAGIVLAAVLVKSSLEKNLKQLANLPIADIDLVKHVTGQGQAAEILPEKVVEAQSLDVDSVSGASYSSKVILKAIEDALASGDIR